LLDFATPDDVLLDEVAKVVCLCLVDLCRTTIAEKPGSQVSSELILTLVLDTIDEGGHSGEGVLSLGWRWASLKVTKSLRDVGQETLQVGQVITG